MNQYIKAAKILFEFFLIAFFCISISSCKKFVQIPPPPNEVVSATVFSDSTDATSAVLGLYANCMNSREESIGDGGLSLFLGLSADELIPTSTTDAFLDQFYTNSLLSNNNYNEDQLWFLAYQLIYQANACLEGIQNSATLSPTLKKELMGEAFFVRAYFYFNLVNLYGGVPLVTSTNYNTNATMGRSSVDSVYAQVVSDLSNAESLFPSQILLGSSRPNYLSTEALLAKVYLYQGQWANAMAASNKVINSGVYSFSPLNSVFLEGSTESIWQLVPVIPKEATFEGGNYVPSSNSVIPAYIINSDLLNTFEPGDLRRTDWLDSNVVGGTVYYYPYKYKLPNNANGAPQEAYTILRLSELYLIRAEGEAETQDVPDAIQDLNTIRVKAGLSQYSGGTDQSSVLSAIYHERQVELFCECGNRWYDLKRTGNINSVMGSPGNVCLAKGGNGWNADWALNPIPLSQLLVNQSLVQNPDY